MDKLSIFHLPAKLRRFIESNNWCKHLYIEKQLIRNLLNVVIRHFLLPFNPLQDRVNYRHYFPLREYFKKSKIVWCYWTTIKVIWNLFWKSYYRYT